MKKKNIKFSTVEDTLENILTNWKYFNGENPPIPVQWVRGESRLFLILGENAGGKSFFRRCVRQEISQSTLIEEVIHLSMESRSGEMYDGFARITIYGDEKSRSTGENSASVVTKAIHTCKERSESHVLYWDEPDIGMSDGAAAGAGIVIANFVRELPEQTKGIFITTHSKALVERLLPTNPHYIYLGGKGPETLKAWLEREIVPVSPEEIKQTSNARWKAIQTILNEKSQELKSAKNLPRLFGAGTPGVKIAPNFEDSLSEFELDGDPLDHD